MENKKRKKISITEGTGGDHAASVHSAGPVIEEKIEVLQATTLTSNNTYCPVCKQWFPSSSYSNHSPCFG